MGSKISFLTVLSSSIRGRSSSFSLASSLSPSLLTPSHCHITRLQFLQQLSLSVHMHAIAASAARMRPMNGSVPSAGNETTPLPSTQNTSPYHQQSVFTPPLATSRALLVGKHGKPHHPFPRAIAPYPVNYEKAVLDAYVLRFQPTSAMLTSVIQRRIGLGLPVTDLRGQPDQYTRNPT